jgi:hypothetical protein
MHAYYTCAALCNAKHVFTYDSHIRIEQLAPTGHIFQEPPQLIAGFFVPMFKLVW